jgi:hypothetical protein
MTALIAGPENEMAVIVKSFGTTIATFTIAQDIIPA